MFCPKCGAQIADTAVFCATCGNPIPQNQQAPAAQSQANPVPPVQPQVHIPPVQPQAPVYQAPATPPPAVTAISRKDFLAKAAGPKTKRTANLIFLTGAISVLLIVLSVVFILNASILDIPLGAAMLTVADADITELQAYISEGYDQLTMLYNEGADQLTPAQQAVVRDFLEVLGDLNDTISINNLRALMDTAVDAETILDEAIMGDEVYEVGLALDVVSGLIIGFFFLPMLFAVLALALRNRGLTITAMIFTFLSQVLLCSFLLTAGTLAVFIVQIVLCGKVYGAHRQYRITGQIA